MKVAVALALVVACVASTYAIPAPRAINWGQVATKVGEIESTVRSAVQQIKSIANNDNPTVGAQIGEKLDAAAVKAEALLKEAEDKIKAQTLTEAQAREILGKLKELLAALQSDLQANLAQLSAAAAGQIRDLFYATYAKVEEKAKELYALLAAFAPAAIDWQAVAAKVGEIETEVRNTVRSVKDIANKDNAAVGEEIAKKLDAAAVNAEALLKEASDKIKDQTLTEAQAREILGKLKDLLAGVQQDLQANLAQLSAAAAGQIRDLFYATYAKVEEKAKELYALLAAFAPAAIDWQAVANKVGEIETEVRNTVRSVKDIANKDNAQVGAEITRKLDAAAVEAEKLLKEAEDKIKAQTLTEAEAKRILEGLKTILAKVQEDLQANLNQLSPAAAGQIRDLFYATYAKVEQLAQQLYALLRA